MELNAFDASISNKLHPFPDNSWNKSEKACLAPSIPDLIPDANWSAKHSCTTSSLLISIMIFGQTLSKTSPIPTGRISGGVYNAIYLLDFKALMCFQGTKEWASLVVRAATASRRELLTFPNFSNIDCHCWGSRPPIPAEPERVLATLWTWAALTSRSC